MKFVNPSATLEKKNEQGENLPNIFKISNRAIDPEAKDPVVFEVPAEKFVYPQVENKEEMVQICGNEERLLEVFNGFLRDDALTEAKNRIRMATSKDHDAVVNSAIEAGKNYTYVETVKITAAEAKKTLSELTVLAASGELSEEELGRRLKAALGL